MVYRFIMDNKDRHPITEMTGLFGVSRSAYYKLVKEGASDLRSEGMRNWRRFCGPSIV
jgi:hypothetical protein